MQTIVVASRKGGSGKTTLTAHLAVAAVLNGRGPVALLDMDPQGSLVHWWNERQAPEPYYIRSTSEHLPDTIDRLRDAGVSLFFIDTPPSDTADLNPLLRLSDFALVPCRPSPHDLRSIGATVAQVEALSIPYEFVLNAAAWQGRLTAEAATLLDEYGRLAPTILHARVDMAACMVDGLTVLEAKPKCKASQEITALWHHLSSRLLELQSAPSSGLHLPQEATTTLPVAAAHALPDENLQQRAKVA